MQPVTPTRWRALPTFAVVLCALALGAVSARAEGAQDRSAPVVHAK